MAITKNLFLPQSGIIQLPSGKKVFSSDIGNFHLRLTQKNPVEWIIADKQGNKVAKGTTESITPPISNSFISKDGKIYIQYDANQFTATTIFSAKDFLGTELESLPSVEKWNEEAQVKAEAAIEAQNSGFEKYLKIGIALLAASLLIKFLK